MRDNLKRGLFDLQDRFRISMISVLECARRRQYLTYSDLICLLIQLPCVPQNLTRTPGGTFPVIVYPNVAKVGGLQSQGAEGEAVVGYCEPSATPDLEPSDFPEG
jgi:hypothetical protein